MTVNFLPGAGLVALRTVSSDVVLKNSRKVISSSFVWRLGLKPGVGQLTDWIRSVALLVVSIHVLGIGSRESFHPK